MKTSFKKALPLIGISFILFISGMIYAMSADTQTKLVQLITGLDQKAAALRAQHKTNPKLGLDKIAASLETRVQQLKNANYSEGSNLFGDAAAYVTVGNAISVTPNFFSARYNDAERQAILLHEAVHLEQGIWEKKLKFWGNRGEVEAYQEEYKWLTVLGVGTGSKDSKYEIYNVVQALSQDYGVLQDENKTQALERELGITPEQLAYFNAATTPRPVTATRPPVPKPQPSPTPAARKEFDYQAALAAWAADFAAEVNGRVYDDGVCRSTQEFEWVMQPFIRDGQVYGASRIWQTNVFYAGEHQGRTVRQTVNEAYDPNNPGPYISLGELRRKYPQFEPK